MPAIQDFGGNLPAPETITSLLAAGGAMGDVRKDHGGVPFVVVPEKFKVQSLKDLMPPDSILRVQASPVFMEAESFCDYVKRFKTDTTILFASFNDSGARVTAVIDYHKGVEPGWCEHKPTLNFQMTKPWVQWMANDRKEMNQSKFALFLEDNQDLFVSPSGADLLELFTTLEGKCDARYQSAVKLKNRSLRFTYEEDVELRGSSSVTNGQVEVPGSLVVQLAPYEYMQPVEVATRLRYKLENRQVSFWYETLRAHEILRDAARAAVASVETLTELKVLIGQLS